MLAERLSRRQRARSTRPPAPQHLKAHAASIRNHAQKLGSKNYWDQFGDAADYVVMYIPGEHFLTAALEQDDNLWAWAFERRVLLATPTNLVAIARTVSSVWRQEKIAEEAAEIARLGKELHSRLATMGGHVARMGRNLELATGAYNAFVGSLETPGDDPGQALRDAGSVERRQGDRGAAGGRERHRGRSPSCSRPKATASPIDPGSRCLPPPRPAQLCDAVASDRRPSPAATQKSMHIMFTMLADAAR